MKNRIITLAVCACAAALACCLAAGCSSGQGESGVQPGDQGEQAESRVQTISAQEAHDMLTSDRHLIVDVRTQEEYDVGHVPNAVLLPLDEITPQTAEGIAPDKEKPVFLYCRSGRRSAEAAQLFAGYGYEQVYDFGGVQSWPYELVSSAEDVAATQQETVENTELPVGVKVVCGKTKPAPEVEE